MLAGYTKSEKINLIKYKFENEEYNGIGETMKSGVKPAFVEGLNNKKRDAFKRSVGFWVQKYRGTIIYLVAGGFWLPPEC